MATSTWTIEIEQSSGSWAIDTAIPRPNQDLETKYISTQQTVKLASGANAFVRPEIRRTKDPITMFFANTTSAFRTQIETYMYNGDKLRITTHVSGEVYIGRFVSMSRVWLVGVEPDEYDIQVIFERSE